MFRKLLILLALLLAPATAHAEWHEASSEHFVVYGDDSPERLRKFAEDLERFDLAIRVLRGLPNDPVGKANRVTVYILPTMIAVEKLIGRKMVAGFYIPRAGGSVAFVPRRLEKNAISDPQSILFHEYAHHMMFISSPHSALPAWLVEGWAEFHSTAQIKGDGSVVFGLAPADRAFGLFSGNPLPLERILGADTRKLRGEEVDALYGRGWALTHYLSLNPGRSGQLPKYIAAINEGKSAADAAQVFGDLKQLHRELEGFIAKRRITTLTVHGKAIKVGQITVRKLTPGEAATMNTRILSKRGVNNETAPEVYAAAKKAAAPFPNDAGAQIVLAEAAFDAEDYPAAVAAADRAIAANPNAIEAHIYKAKARMEIAGLNADESRETWREIRTSISTANRLDPDHPEPLLLNYKTFGETSTRPTQNAKDGLYYAFAVAPYDTGLRFYVAQVKMHDGQLAEARAMLLPLAFNPHGDQLADVARKLIDQIDQKLADKANAAAD